MLQKIMDKQCLANPAGGAQAGTRQSVIKTWIFASNKWTSFSASDFILLLIRVKHLQMTLIFTERIA
jgi:hypothetical protein